MNDSIEGIQYYEVKRIKSHYTNEIFAIRFKTFHMRIFHHNIKFRRIYLRIKIYQKILLKTSY